jgi:diguanylate cyclase (GGDEF)-like protein/PAS domain S-box-containing protein
MKRWMATLPLHSGSPVHQSESSRAVGRVLSLATELMDASFACLARLKGEDWAVTLPVGALECDAVVAEALAGREVNDLTEPGAEMIVVDGEAAGLLTVPVRRGKRLLGVMCVVRHTRPEWSRKEADWLQAIAELVAAEWDLATEWEERARVEAVLSHTVELYGELVETASDMIYRADRNGCFTYVNSAAVQVTGYSAAELVGMNFGNLVRADYRERLTRLYARQIEDGTATTYTEFPIQQSGGEEVWVGQNVQLMREGGEILGIQGVARNITHQRAVELALRESEVRFRNVVDNLGEGLVMTDLDDTILYINDRLTELTGYAPQELVGQVAHQILFPQEEWEVGRAELRRRLRGETNRYQVRHVRKDGVRSWFEVNAVPHRDPEGEIVGTIALVQDIGERKAAQDALHESEARFRAIFDGAAYGIAVMLPDGEIVQVNHSIERKMGAPAESLRRRYYSEFIHPADLASSRELWQELFSEGGLHRVVEQRILQGDSVIWVRVGYSLVCDAAGEPNYVIAIGSDITLQKARDEELLESSERYRLMVEGSEQVFFYIHDNDHHFEYLSPSVREVLGYEPEELLGRSYDVLMTGHPSDEMVNARTDGLLEGGDALSTYTVITRHKDGRLVPIEVAESPIRRDGRVVGLQGFARDITDRQRAREALEKREEYFRALTENALDVVQVINADRTTRYVSPSVERLLGYLPEELIGKSAEFLIHPDDLPTMIQRARESRGAGGALAFEFRARHRNGGYKLFEGVIQNLLDDPVVAGVVVNSRDVSERKRVQEESLRLAALSRENPSPVLECDAAGVPMHVNPAALRVTEELGLRAVRDMLPENHEQLVRSVLEEGQEFESVEVTVENRIFNWSYRPQREAGVVYLFAIDITSRRLMEEQLRHDALHDALTGLPNRLLFLERLAHAILRARRREQFLFAVLFLDLDRFKVINDSLGHHVGDELLIVISNRLQACLRPEDTVARLGGDEFAILLEDITDVSDATRIAERIHAELSWPVNLSGFDVFTSASIGIALSSTTYDRPEFLLRNADMAMYRAKASGEARFEVFDRAMHAQALTRLQLETDLRRAVDRNELELFYQPVIEMASGRMVSLEALIRWRHPDRGRMSPDSFIPVAEETGIILQIGGWVIRQAAEQLREWRQRYPAHASLSVSVNLSAKQLSQPNLVEQIERVVIASGIGPGALRLEITESAVMENAETASVVLGRLKAVGVQLSLDDFGTGYSSLSHLHRFPLDALKIDRSFIGRMTEEERSKQLVLTILTLSRSLGVVAVAEGIETREQLELLRSMQCGYAQGFLFSEPISVSEMEKLLAADRSW